MTVNEYCYKCAQRLDLDGKEFVRMFGVSSWYKRMLDKGLIEPSFQLILKMEDACGIPITKISKHLKGVREHIEILKTYKGLPIIRTIAREMKIDARVLDKLIFGTKINTKSVILIQKAWASCKIDEKLPEWESDKRITCKECYWIYMNLGDILDGIKSEANGYFEFKTNTGLYNCTMERLNDEMYLFSAVYTSTGKTSVKRIVRI